jgi:integron integrase
VARYPELDRILIHAAQVLRVRGYSPRTRKAYLGWIRRFLYSQRVLPPTALGKEHVDRWLTWLTDEARLAAKSRNQAASALAFMFREVLGRDLMKDVERARGQRRIPVVLSHAEARRVIDLLKGQHHLIASLLYGSGLRLSEALQLRIKDLDFELAQLIVRDGKGNKDRYAVLPQLVRPALQAQVRRVRRVHAGERMRGGGWAALPGALHRKDPEAGFELAWQFVFPATRTSKDAATGRFGRWHLDASAVQRAVKKAVRAAGVTKAASCHTFRHSFATELLRDGHDIRKVQDLLGHKDIRVTMIYLHTVAHTGHGVRSPLDRPTRGRD